jgi:hypothetical protein
MAVRYSAIASSSFPWKNKAKPRLNLTALTVLTGHNRDSAIRCAKVQRAEIYQTSDDEEDHSGNEERRIRDAEPTDEDRERRHHLRKERSAETASSSSQSGSPHQDHEGDDQHGRDPLYTARASQPDRAENPEVRCQADRTLRHQSDPQSRRDRPQPAVMEVRASAIDGTSPRELS